MKRTTNRSFMARTVMLCTIATRLLGFVRIAAIAAFFGASGTADVLHLVFNIPNNLRKLLAEGALTTAFVPVLAGETRGGVPSTPAVRLVRTMITFQCLALVPLLLLSTLFADPIISLLFDFADVERHVLAVRLFRWMVHYVLLVSCAAIMMSALHVHDRFLVPALTPLFFSVSVVTSLLLLNRQLGIFSVCVGVLFGGAAQLLFLAPQFHRIGYRFRPLYAFRDKHFRSILRRWLPMLLVTAVFVINQQVAFYFASGLEEGSSAAMANAITFWQLPNGIFAAAIVTVLFPQISRLAAQNEHEGIRESLQFGLRQLIVLLLPSAVVLAVLGREIVAIALQRGAFTMADTLLASRVLALYCIGLVGVGAHALLQRALFALGLHRRALYAALLLLIIDVGLSLWLKETPLRVAGLALANSIAFTVAALVQLAMLSRRLGGINPMPTLHTLMRTILTLLPVALLLMLHRLSDAGGRWIVGATGETIARLAFLCVVSVLMVVGLFTLLREKAFFSFFVRTNRDE